ncbi:Putative uncharacterized protein [Taphrina deformans PYCC 5710]|uniref:Trehalase n=1 Tax=Taphrina deformans (strain PYCC 5710 / ATCC 11124 / CBS 356.35 / IMI 108563 / JCM 9778 / NBRC 8474) TaxID=1097556 RepID=R4X7K2_TAPDE|nr:Putative uncharacterized protein [Taphrina deformans PYCC 5710]|eukprot:CCG81098.1 Putative uncharacterized protein [Taphrina deformans PYCC 5710]
MRQLLRTVFLARTILALYQDNSTGTIAPCDSPIFCQGALLQDIQLAAPYDDSKTFVDLPTIRPVQDVLNAYQNLSRPITNNTQLQSFLSENFGAVGLETGAVNSTLSTDPTFLSHVNSSIVADFVRQIVDIWPDLTRQVVNTTLCAGCDSSFIPPSRPFVVAGGRFREVYYWDSFFILEGLLRTKGNYTQIAKNTIENFLDFIDQFGFVPNGGRKYYLNRSQPPLLANMIQIYIQNTNDTSILPRAVPALLKEQAFYEASAVRLNASTVLYRYNNQPRPESYLEDYETANNRSYISGNGTTFAASALDNRTQALLYQNLASAAESGWDFSSRWLTDPTVAVRDSGFPLRSVNTIEIVPVDLQAIQYSNARLISSFYSMLGNTTAAHQWSLVATLRGQTLQMFNYNATLGAYFDYNLTSERQNTLNPPSSSNGSSQPFFSPAQFYPLAFGAARGLFDSDYDAVLQLYQPVVSQLDRYPGGVAATNINTGQQWDQPNVWPPLQYILIKGLLETLPDSRVGAGDTGYQKVQDLALELAQRYVDSTYCTWRATGGSHPALGISQLNGSDPTTNGTMFEKYSNLATNAVGGGGEYSTVEGFGWSNGVLIWIADVFGTQLVTPQCDAMNQTAMKTLAAKKSVVGIRFQR